MDLMAANAPHARRAARQPMVRCTTCGRGNAAVSINVAYKGDTIVSDSCLRKRLPRCEPTSAQLAFVRD